jgi:2-succinyl-6-hydroxy-2,4-cyclohexadiene-1-carboxylate synthase
MRITALPGFLGLQSDWDFLRQDGLELGDGGDVILGYSMGGRLALQSLLDGAKYERAVIVSAAISEPDPGRRERDEEWARRFESEDWSSLMRDWNAQPVFGGESNPLARIESDYDRRALAAALRRWSPAVLPLAGPRLHEIAIPVLWIAGERDARYVGEGRRAVDRLPRGELWICPEAGHRVPWEQPASFISRIKEFLDVDQPSRLH